MSLLSLSSPDIQEWYDADIANEEAHGEFLVCLCNEEIVDRQTASCLVIARPNTHPDDVNYLKAKVLEDGSGVEIVGPSKSKPYLTHSDQWMGLLKAKNFKEKYKTEKLVTTLSTTVTKLKKIKGTKTTTIFAKGFSGDAKLSNEYFSPNASEGELKMLPIPYKYKLKLGSGPEVVRSEVMCIWRAFIVGSEQDVQEEATETADSDMDMLLELMKNCKPAGDDDDEMA
jgi:hypothetical protein